MLIKRIKSCSGPDGAYVSGQRYDVDQDVGQAMIDAGEAIFLKITDRDLPHPDQKTEPREEDEEKDDQPINTAMKKSVKNASKNYNDGGR